jgi:hypothetical protein
MNFLRQKQGKILNVFIQTAVYHLQVPYSKAFSKNSTLIKNKILMKTYEDVITKKLSFNHPLDSVP